MTAIETFLIEQLEKRDKQIDILMQRLENLEAALIELEKLQKDSLAILGKLEIP